MLNWQETRRAVFAEYDIENEPIHELDEMGNPIFRTVFDARVHNSKGTLNIAAEIKVEPDVIRLKDRYSIRVGYWHNYFFEGSLEEAKELAEKQLRIQLEEILTIIRLI